MDIAHTEYVGSAEQECDQLRESRDGICLRRPVAKLARKYRYQNTLALRSSGGCGLSEGRHAGGKLDSHEARKNEKCFTVTTTLKTPVDRVCQVSYGGILAM